MRELPPGLWALESSSSWGCNTYLIDDAANSGPDGELIPFTPRQVVTDQAQADATLRLLSALPVRMFCPGHTPAVERTGH